MAKIIITADIHCGIPKKLNYSIWALEVIRRYAIKSGINDIIILGDLFHDRVNLNIEVINAIYEFYEKTSIDAIKWYAFPGNHDMYLKNSWSIHSLRPLAALMTVIPGVSRIEIAGTYFWVIPFIYQEEKYMEVLRGVEEKMNDGDVLLTHIGVHEAKLNECFLIKNWSMVDFRKSKFDRVFTGHFHCYQQVGNNVWYPGSPFSFRYDEGVVPHGFIVYDTITRAVDFIKIKECIDIGPNPPPEYLTICDDDVVNKTEAFKGNMIRVLLTKNYTRDELAKMEKAVRNGGAVGVSWLRPKESDAEIEAVSKSGISMSRPASLLEAWIEKDKPQDLSRKLLLELNDQIIQEAEERIVTEVDEA